MAGIMFRFVVQNIGKVNETIWDGAKKQIMVNINYYMIYLKDIKTNVEINTINPNNLKKDRQYIKK